MKFAFNVVARLYVVALMVHWIQSLDNRRDLVIEVSKNDRIWAKHLNMGIKFDPKKLSAAAREVLTDLKVLKAKPTATEPSAEQTPDEEQAAGIEKDKAHGPHHEMLVARALHVVVEVASRYSEHGMALDFGLDVIASAINCKTLMYILVQLHAIKKTNDLQNDAITTQPSEVWNTLAQVLNKVAVLKKSVEEDFELYQQWEVVASQVETQDLPQDFEVFQRMVEKKLDESCELSTFEHIMEHIQIENAHNWDSAIDTMRIFMDCQKILKEMFKDIPKGIMDDRIWENTLEKPEYKESNDEAFPMEI